MSVGLSAWWATPARPDQHFSAEELAASERYHRPMRQAGAAAVTARIVLLLLAIWLTSGPLTNLGSGVVGDGGQVGTSWLSTAGFLEVLTSWSLLIGAMLTALALRIPAIAVDSWFEYRFKHGTLPSESFQPVPMSRFAVTVISFVVLVWFVLVLIGGAIYRLAATNENWHWLVTTGVLLVLGLASAVESPVRQWLPSRGTDLDQSSEGFDDLSDRFRLPRVRFLVGGTTPGTTETDRSHCNATAIGLGRNRRIVVTKGLLDEPRSLQEFVVAHELSHIKRHHVLVQTALTATVLVAAVQLLAFLASTEWFGDAFDIDLYDPLHMPAIAILLLAVGAVAGPFVSWLGRAHERVADADAVAAVGPLPVDLLRQLHGQTNTDLDPPWWMRIIGQHPSPAERLEFAKRHRRVI